MQMCILVVWFNLTCLCLYASLKLCLQGLSVTHLCLLLFSSSSLCGLSASQQKFIAVGRRNGSEIERQEQKTPEDARNRAEEQRMDGKARKFVSLRR